MKDETYFLHQTPLSVALKIIENIDWKDGENVCEAFRGESAFYDQLPDYVNKSYAEIEEGIDFRSLDYSDVDTIISNPPFSVDLSKDVKQTLKDNFLYSDKRNSENLFIERYYQLLKPRGRMGIVLPESVFDTAENKYIRLFLFRYASIKSYIRLLFRLRLSLT